MRPTAFGCLILCRCFAIHFFKDAAEISNIPIPAIGGYLFYTQAIIVQHELCTIDTRQVQIITKARLPFLPEQP